MIKMYQVVCMNKMMNSFQVHAENAREALEMLVKEIMPKEEQAIFTKTDGFERVEFCGYKFMVKK